MVVIILSVIPALVLAEDEIATGFESIGLTPEKQDVRYWLKSNSNTINNSATVMLDSLQVDAINQKIHRTEPTYTDLNIFPLLMLEVQIAARIHKISKRPTRELYNQKGNKISSAQIDGLIKNLNLSKNQATKKVEFGLITKRTSLRTFPSDLRAFSKTDDTDIDRFQETALFPGTPVVVLQQSLDKQWLFVVSEFYSAWLKADSVALGARNDVITFASKQPRLYISGATVRTVFNPEVPEISELVLDMGTSYPLLDWPLMQPVNGQGTLATHVIEMPVRNEQAQLRFKPVLLPRSADTQNTYLPLNQSNIIQQSFKFSGERYGWGHDYNGRDCSGYVSEVYRSMGLKLPRNTSDQERSLAYDREIYSPDLTRAQRLARINNLHIGDLIYIPGHVMLVIGKDKHGPWVIHDSHGSGLMINGRFEVLPTNSVAVTPLLPMAFSREKMYLDAITAVQHIIPRLKP
jgi:hypothetical protein